MAANDKKITQITIERRSSKDSLDVRTPRTARFAEATSVYSPIDAPKSPFATNHYKPQPQVSDVGFGYVQSVEMEETDRNHLPPPTPRGMAPLKSALKSPGAPPRTPGRPSMILSPTFREERDLEKQESSLEKEQAKDLVSYNSNLLDDVELTMGRK